MRGHQYIFTAGLGGGGGRGINRECVEMRREDVMGDVSAGCMNMI